MTNLKHPTRRAFLRSAAALSTAGLASRLDLMHFVAAANAQSTPPTDYKALVCVFLFGGNDGNNTLIPIDALKIDRKFIQHISGHKHSNSLTTAIISLAHNLGLKVVGEGIETTDQLHFLTNHKCDEGQGFLISRPIPGDKLIAVLKTIKFPQ